MSMRISDFSDLFMRFIDEAYKINPYPFTVNLRKSAPDNSSKNLRIIFDKDLFHPNNIAMGAENYLSKIIYLHQLKKTFLFPPYKKYTRQEALVFNTPVPILFTRTQNIDNRKVYEVTVYYA